MIRKRVDIQAEHSAKHRAHNHGRRPDLVWRAGGQRLMIVPGKHLGDMPQRSIRTEQRIGPQIGISGQRPMVTVFPHRRPSRKQRPHRSKMIAARAVPGITRRNNPHAPVRLMARIREQVDGGFTLRFVQQTEPHRHRGQHAGQVHRLIISVERETEQTLFLRPEHLVHQSFVTGKILLELSADILLPREVR